VSAAGRTGSDRALKIMREEISQTLAMIGCTSVSNLGPQFLAEEPDLRR
jgi:(S)-mandelate dehydrogenase